MVQHKSLTAEVALVSLRETRSNSGSAVPHTALLCDEPHVLFNNALLYSGQALTRGQRFQA